MSLTASTILYAAAGGILPALGWLWFFLHEDPHPEPRTKLVETFLAGMIIVPIAILGEELITTLTGSTSGETLVFWAILEEVLKLAAAWIVALQTRFMDEPIDAIIYLVTVSLGFAAVENSLFLFSTLSGATFLNTLLTGGLRFIGATLVHVVSSGLLGACIAWGYYRKLRLRVEAIIVGVIIASLLHSIFNLLIMNTVQTHLLYIFSGVWAGIIALMLSFERAKYIERTH